MQWSRLPRPHKGRYCEVKEKLKCCLRALQRWIEQHFLSYLIRKTLSLIPADLWKMSGVRGHGVGLCWTPAL
jgi:hypothetical protein